MSVQKSVNKEVISAHKTKLSHPKPTKSRAPVPSHVSKKPSVLPPSSSQPPQKFKRMLSSHADHTPSPSPSPAESPYCSPIQPQSFDDTPNNEQNLHHAHSSDENHQDDSLTQEGEPVTQEGLLKIVPFGNEFNPCTAVRHVTTAIKSKISEFCPTWGHASVQMRDLNIVCGILNTMQEFIKGSARLRGLMKQERVNYSKDSNYVPKYIPTPVWRQLLHYWATDLHFKNWLVANTVNRASNTGSSMHTGGSISMGGHACRMEKATGVKPSKCHTKKEGDVEASKEGLDIPDNYTIWNEFVTKKKKKEKAKEQEMINEEQKVKLNDAEHKLNDQGCKLKFQQKRISSTEKIIHALYKKLNLPLPLTLFDLAEDELRTGSSDDEDDNMSD
ncbi:hypothetical protein Ahy_B06g083166 [Arachis hypogaea]|uniref:Uncharacterized protein n=1 Tax=Arachis hypogaea TaxID=3818 RepID=A0A444YPI9_ARAHY|nr:hypothetical protein Ahy_B06g083166 [Arachis hypogaea]